MRKIENVVAVCNYEAVSNRDEKKSATNRQYQRMSQDT